MDFGITLNDKSRDRAIIYTMVEARAIRAILIPIYEKVMGVSHAEALKTINDITQHQLNETFGLLSPDSDVGIRPEE